MAEAEQPPRRPPAPVQTETFRKSRPSIVGPDSPQHPYPVRLSGEVQRGFGRGGKDLGCPTANLPDSSIEPLVSSVKQTGIYFGYAKVGGDLDGADKEVFPMAMSFGYNPVYGNEQLSAEVHIMHEFKRDFYGHPMQVVVLGYIRPELNYTSREALIDDIETDKRVAQTSLARDAYRAFQTDRIFS